MIVYRTDVFDKWLRRLKDQHAREIITVHMDRIRRGNIGKVESVGDGVFEKKINYGPGYRLYFCRLNNTWVLLLCGGDKSSQRSDIDKAKELKGGIKWTTM